MPEDQGTVSRVYFSGTRECVPKPLLRLGLTSPWPDLYQVLVSEQLLGSIWTRHDWELGA